MPTPLDAFPCGSASMMSVLFSAAATLAARLTVVVVLPTPPFWLATTTIFGRDCIALLGQALAIPDRDHRSGSDDRAASRPKRELGSSSCTVPQVPRFLGSSPSGVIQCRQM